MDKTHARVSRRRFLLAATAGTAVTAAALVGTKEAPNSTATGGVAPPHKGYQLTDHVKNYYRTAKI